MVFITVCLALFSKMFVKHHDGIENGPSTNLYLKACYSVVCDDFGYNHNNC